MMNVKMIKLIVNTNLLREIDERKLITTYARLITSDDFSDRNIIKDNLKQILDWDSLGNKGLGIYCSQFEDLKKSDWETLIDFIIDNSEEIINLSKKSKKLKEEELNKLVLSEAEKKEVRNQELYLDENYKVSGRGKKAKPCTYKGRTYKSRKECQYKEGISHSDLYIYLAQTGQLDPYSAWVKLYGENNNT